MTIRLLEPDVRMYAGEQRGLFVEVTNETEEIWPGGVEEEPRVRLSYRLDGMEGARSPLPAPLAPGESAISPLTVIAPGEAGRHSLELDLVHEAVRWFGAGPKVELEVVPAGETQRSLPGRLARRLGRRRIPPVLHRVWFGPEPMPEEHSAYGETWRHHHPRWQHRLWGDDDLHSLGISREVSAVARNASAVSDLARFQIMARHGGVYVDTDTECLRPIDPLLRGVSAFASFSLPGLVATGVLGSVPAHAAFQKAAELALLAVDAPPPRTGPTLLTHVLWEFPDVTIFPRQLFSPYLWNEPRRPGTAFPDAYAVHHWTLSWLAKAP